MYANSSPHCGFAMELIQADVLARHNRLRGNDTFFLTGTDEHGSSVAKSAQKENIEPQAFVDKISEQVKELTKILNISNDDFIRTTDKEHHWPSVIKLWQKLEDREDLYKKKYKGLYCVGHESFIKKSDLIDGLCPLHKTIPGKIEEENWFFRLSKYKKEVRTKIENGELNIVPVSKKNEILNVIEDAEDISVSRPISVLTWGIPVPNDPEQRIWVWLDALPNYISALDYANDGERFQKFWPGDIHLIGKDILRFHALIWPAMLLAADMELPRNIFVHGFITVDGQKMSKTVGNVVDPIKLVEKYGADPVRYFLLREIPSTEDGDFSYKKLEDRYNGDLANNLGNLVSRVAKLIETKFEGVLNREEKYLDSAVIAKIEATKLKVDQSINDFRLHEALSEIFTLFSFANEYINDRAPWAQSDPAHINETMINLAEVLIQGNQLLWPFLPETAEKIASVLGQDGVSNNWNKITVADIKPLFPRI